MKPIAIFYHCLFALDRPDNVLQRACEIVCGQMQMASRSGLVDAASHFVVGVNGGLESVIYTKLFIPPKAQCVFHGLKSHAENPTIVLLERWLADHPDWYVLYFHAKGCTHPPDSTYGLTVSDPWRNTMMGHLVLRWRQCVADLDAGAEAAGCNWLTGMGWDKSQNLFGGNFWWAKSDYLRTLPSIMARERIKTSGLLAAESRYESEVWIGNGPRLPKVAVYHPGGM